MITEDRWNHILGVARQAARLAEKFFTGDAENRRREMFLLGMLHDIGYEFAETGRQHAVVGGEILRGAGYAQWHAVAVHGDPDVEEMTDELFLLNCADMTTGPKGEALTMAERLREIGERFGRESVAYEKSARMVTRLQNDARFSMIKEEGGD